MFPTGCGNVTSHLVKMKKLQSRVILFSARFDTSALPVCVLALLFQVSEAHVDGRLRKNSELGI